MRRLFLAAFLIASTSATFAQDQIWEADRNSNTLRRIEPWGAVAQTVSTATNLRRVVQAPDGKLWSIRFIQAAFDIYSQTGTLLTSVTNPTGNPYDVAFDRFGHGWVSGGTSCNEYDANGVFVASYPLTSTAPLGITVDADGNKWIAHRVNPGHLSKIDPLGVITNYLVNATAMQPTVAYADFRGIGVSSHIWVIGDSSGLVAEFDATGTQLNTFPSGLTSIGAFAQDAATGDYFIGSFGTNGTIARMTPTGTVSGTFTNPPSTLGMNFDSFGRLWATTRITTGPPCEARRYDITTNTLEMKSVVGLGTQSPPSTRRDYALIVDQFGDADGDGVPNAAEILQLTSPWDAQSNSFTSMNTIGPMASGSNIAIDIQAPFTASTAIAAAATYVPPGLTFPGFSGAFLLDLNTLLLDPFTGSPVLFTTNGPTQFPLALPPAIGGLSLVIQGLTIDGAGVQFTNVTGLYIYI